MNPQVGRLVLRCRYCSYQWITRPNAQKHRRVRIPRICPRCLKRLRGGGGAYFVDVVRTITSAPPALQLPTTEPRRPHNTGLREPEFSLLLVPQEAISDEG